MDNPTLVKKSGYALDSIKGINTNHLQEGTGNLKGGEVVLDLDVHFYFTLIPNGGYYSMGRKRIIAFRNPNLILILKTEGGYFPVDTNAQLMTPKDFRDKHQKFLERISQYGFTYKDGLKVLNLQELIDREEFVFRNVMANY